MTPLPLRPTPGHIHLRAMQIYPHSEEMQRKWVAQMIELCDRGVHARQTGVFHPDLHRFCYAEPLGYSVAERILNAQGKAKQIANINYGRFHGVNVDNEMLDEAWAFYHFVRRTRSMT